MALTGISILVYQYYIYATNTFNIIYETLKLAQKNFQMYHLVIIQDILLQKYAISELFRK